MHRSALVRAFLIPVLSATAWSQSAPGVSGEAPPPSPESTEPVLPSGLKREQDPRPPAPSDRIVVTASRAPQTEFDAPFATDVLLADDLFQRSYRSVPQALRDVPGVMVQETSVSQGSPYIRGFTGYQNLLLIDGVRLNNSVFRSGPNQYWSTIDPLGIDRLEIVKGPSSVLYGSDAIGGTVQVMTKDPWTTGPGVQAGGGVLTRFATADESVWGRGELSFGMAHDDGSHTALLISGGRKYFGNVHGGADTGELPYTAFDDASLDLKLVHRLDDRTRLVFAHQQFRQYDAPRTHRTIFAQSFRGTTVGSDLLHEFDQKRVLTYGQFHAEQLDGVFDAVHASLSLHSQSETRQRERSGRGLDESGFSVDTYGAWVQFESVTSLGRLSYGAEWYHDEVDSFSSGNPIQGPVGDDATYDLAAVYVQDEYRVSDRLTVVGGGRFNYAAANANRVQDPASSDAIELEDSWDDVVFSARVRYELAPEAVAAYAGVSQGFRAPNLSDLTRFDTARSNEFEVPAPGLDSENYVTYETGLKGRAPDVSWEAAYFWTEIRDQIVRTPTGNVDPSGDQEVTKTNAGDGRIWGIELAGSYRLLPGTVLFGNATYMEGRVANYELLGGTLEDAYMTRLMPLTALGGVRYEDPETGRFWGETLVRYADDADKLSGSDLRDTQRIPPGGTPGYAVWDLGLGYRFEDESVLNVRLENVTDVDYRVHGSGTNMPGRNFVVTFETRF
jgi:hemoglobin/transferrin/lactoferrin receptor protein